MEDPKGMLLPPNQPTSPPREGLYAWCVVGGLCLAYMTSMLDRFLLSIALPSIKEDLQLTDVELGLLVGPAFALFYCLFSIPLGRLADRVHRARLIGLALLFWSVMTGLVAFASSFEALFAVRAMIGVGEAALLPAGASLIAAYFARERMGKPTSVFLAGASFGKAAAFIGGGALLAALTAAGGLNLGHHFAPWQALFVLAMLPGCFLGLAFLFVRDPGRSEEAHQKASFADALAHLRRFKGAYSLHMGYTCCGIVASSVFLAWGPSLYVRDHGLEPAAAAMITGLATVIAGPLGYWIGGTSLDAMRRRGIDSAPALLIGGAIILLVPFTALLALADNLYLSIAGYGLAQMAAQMAGTPALVGMHILTPQRHLGVLTAVYVTIVTIGTLGLGPLATGWVNDRFFDGQNLGLAILAVVTLFGAVGLALTAIARRPYERASRQVHAEVTGLA